MVVIAMAIRLAARVTLIRMMVQLTFRVTISVDVMLAHSSFSLICFPYDWQAFNEGEDIFVLHSSRACLDRDVDDVVLVDDPA